MTARDKLEPHPVEMNISAHPLWVHDPNFLQDRRTYARLTKEGGKKTRFHRSYQSGRSPACAEQQQHHCLTLLLERDFSFHHIFFRGGLFKPPNGYGSFFRFCVEISFAWRCASRDGEMCVTTDRDTSLVALASFLLVTSSLSLAYPAVSSFTLNYFTGYEDAA